MSSIRPVRKHGVFAVAAACALLAITLPFSACDRKSGPRIVLYSSMDADVLSPIVKRFEKESGIGVDVVTDTEATKSTGLVERLISEKDAPRADVWWSSETLGTVLLSRAGVLAPYSSMDAENTGSGGWPGSLRGKKQDWYGLAPRPRVIVYNTKSVAPPALPPRQIEDLASARFASKGVAIADPAFGTTRGHIAVLFATLGDKEFAKQMGGVKWRVYDGNAAVVRAVANGEVDAGLADFDDFIGAEKNGWPVAVSFPILATRAGEGIIATPGTVAVVKGTAHEADARRLIDFILSRSVQEELATGPWRGMPVHTGVAPADERLRLQPIAPVQWELVAGALKESGAAWKKALGGK